MALEVGWASYIEQACRITDIFEQNKYIKHIDNRIQQSIESVRETSITNTLIDVVAEIYKGKENTFQKDLAKCKLFADSEIKQSVSATTYLMVLLNLIEKLKPAEYNRFVNGVVSKIEFDSLGRC